MRPLVNSAEPLIDRSEASLCTGSKNILVTVNKMFECKIVNIF